AMKNKKIGTVAVFGLVGLGFAGCASLQSGTTQQMVFNSNPLGAEVSVGAPAVKGQLLGRTPLIAQVPRGSDMSAVLAKEGFTPMLQIAQMFSVDVARRLQSLSQTHRSPPDFANESVSLAGPWRINEPAQAPVKAVEQPPVTIPCPFNVKVGQTVELRLKD